MSFEDERDVSTEGVEGSFYRVIRRLKVTWDESFNISITMDHVNSYKNNCEIFRISRFILGIVWRKTSCTITLVIILEELLVEHLEYESIGGLTIEDKIH